MSSRWTRDGTLTDEPITKDEKAELAAEAKASPGKTAAGNAGEVYQCMTCGLEFPTSGRAESHANREAHAGYLTQLRLLYMPPAGPRLVLTSGLAPEDW